MGGKVMWLPSDELKKARNEGIEQGIERGIEQGTDKMCKLMQKIMESGDMEALSRIATDKAYRNELYKRFGI